MRQLSINTLLYFSARAFPALSGLLFVMIFVRVLGRADYGKYALIQSAILFTSNTGSGWLAQAIIRFRSRFDHPGINSAFIKATQNGLYLTVGFAIFFLALFLSLGLKAYFLNVFLALIAATLLMMYAIKTATQQAFLRPRKILYAEFTRGLTTLFFPLIVIYLTKTPTISVLLGGLICGAGLANLVLGSSKQTEAVHRPHEKRILKILVSFGLPIGIWLGLSTLLNVSDRYFIKWLMNDAAVGTYSAIYDVVYNSFGILLAPVLYAAHPMIMKFWNEGKKIEAIRILKQSLVLEILIGVAALTVLSFLSGFLVKLILGVKDVTATGLVVPVAAGAIMWQFAMLLHKPLEIRRAPYRMIAYILIALLFNALGNWVFIPHYGYIASAYITVISSVIYMILVIIDNLFWIIQNHRELMVFQRKKTNTKEEHYEKT